MDHFAGGTPPACFVFDFAPTRALRQLSEYGIGLSPSEPNPEKAVADLVSFLPVLAYDGAIMQQIDAGMILDYAMSGTSATLLARKWESAMLVNVDNGTLQRVLDSDEAMAAVEKIEGWRSLGDNAIETIINKSENIKGLKKKAKDEGKLSGKEKIELTSEEKEFKSLRKKIQEKLIKFATRIPAFMYLTDFRENTLKDVITRIEPGLFRTVTGLTVADFNLLVDLKVFNQERMNSAVFAFRRYEDSSLRYTGIDSHPGLTRLGGYDTVIAKGIPQATEPSQGGAKNAHYSAGSEPLAPKSVSEIKKDIEAKWGVTASVQGACRILEYATNRKLKPGETISFGKILDVLEVKELTPDTVGAMSILAQSDCAVLRVFAIFKDEEGETYRLSPREFQLVQDSGILTHPVTQTSVSNVTKKVFPHFEVTFDFRSEADI